MTSPIYQLLITLQDATPPIWRRMQVSSDTNLRYLHYLIQAVMGWTDSHLYQYECGGVTYGELDDDAPPDLRSAVDFSLQHIAPRLGSEFVYLYDFGDEWTHRVLVEGVLIAEEGKPYPLCIDGARACPPEDFGGAFTYSLWLRRMGNDEIDAEELEDYPGFDFDPAKFSAASTTRRMRRVETNAKYRTWD